MTLTGVMSGGPACEELGSTRLFGRDDQERFAVILTNLVDQQEMTFSNTEEKSPM